MDLQTMRYRVAENISYDDGAGAVLTGKDITSDMIDKWLNDRYLEEIVPLYERVHPEFYTQEGTYSNYTATGTVAAGSTASTLVATGAIFTSNMVDALVINTTDSTTRYITAYTNTTTVTVDSAIGDDWDGDTIYIITGIYTLSGNATDAVTIKEVGLKYASTDENFTRCTRVDDRDAYQTERGRGRDQRFDKLNPIYIFETVDVSGVPTSAIKVRPIDEWTTYLTCSVFVKYVEQPGTLTDSLVPRLPLGYQKMMVEGATANAFRKLGQFKEADGFEEIYQEKLVQLKRVDPAEKKKGSIDFMGQSRYFTSRRG